MRWGTKAEHGPRTSFAPKTVRTRLSTTKPTDISMKILIAIDGSKSALRAVKYATTLSTALAQSPHITLVTVHDDTGLRHLAKHLPKDGLADYFRDISERDLKPARKLIREYSEPGNVLVDLVPCGTTGIHLFSKALNPRLQDCCFAL